MMTREIEAANSYERDLIERCHKLTRIATHALNYLEANEVLGLMVESINDPCERHELESWWDRHKAKLEADNERRERQAEVERKRQKALSKLTPRELKLLKLKK